ncbi:MAG: bifunctional hydroxymethylpyrimidine kinase/phosphomethylpyrimidine kinase [Deltaproteobacteria bacterium]|nr:bifunctional hydroxymethylpyrimidine kinase/phosphomethylpyrimidine kinase [Deltaproteobacteria bacterium]
MKHVLTIAGSDSSAGAGIQADLKTIAAHGLYGLSVITAVTAQNTQSILASKSVSAQLIGEQIDAVFQDIRVDAVKIGMVSETESIQVITDRLKQYAPANIVLDPVMISETGFPLLNPRAIETLLTQLFPLATIVTPNIPEAERITGQPIACLADMDAAAKQIHDRGAKYVLLKGGHLQADATDVLYNGRQFQHFSGKRIATQNTHGTGCTLSSAIAANLATGHDAATAVSLAKQYISGCISSALDIGKGAGPLNHFYAILDISPQNR